MAKAVKAGGANFLRGGAYKPRTSPYSFQGLEMCIRDRLKRTRAIYRALGLPTRAGANKEKVLAYMQPVSYTHLDVYKRQGRTPQTRGASAAA